MSAPRFERDDQEEIPGTAGPRRLGRVVPAPEPTLIDIIVGGVVFATIDPTRLKAKAQIDLERARGALDLLKWCQNHGGVAADELAALEAELGEMPLQAIMDLIVQISTALGGAVQIPKQSGRR